VREERELDICQPEGALQIPMANVPGHKEALEKAGRERRRDGAYAWRIYEEPSEKGCFVETFLSDSWLDHLRQHERVTNADRALEEAVRRFQIGDGSKTTHLVATHSRRRPR
jgi:hypothetical protein